MTLKSREVNKGQNKTQNKRIPPHPRTVNPILYHRVFLLNFKYNRTTTQYLNKCLMHNRMQIHTLELLENATIKIRGDCEENYKAEFT